MVLCVVMMSLMGIPDVFGSDSPSFIPKFSLAKPGYDYVFPRDHGSHDQFQTEWWYFTGHLLGSNGRRFGYELTFFRRGIDSADVWANPSEWAMRHVYLAHFALTDEKANDFELRKNSAELELAKPGQRKIS